MRFELVRELLRYDEARSVCGVTLLDIETAVERESKTDRYLRRLEKIEVNGKDCLECADNIIAYLGMGGYKVSRVVFWLSGDSRYLIWTDSDGYYWGQKADSKRDQGQRITFGREDFLHV